MHFICNFAAPRIGHIGNLLRTLCFAAKAHIKRAARFINNACVFYHLRRENAAERNSLRNATNSNSTNTFYYDRQREIT